MTAAAEDAPLLAWSAPSGCPSQSWVDARAGRYLGRALSAAVDSQLSFAVAIAAQPDGALEAQLAIDSDAGHRVRTLRDRDCVLLADAIAFIIARAIDPSVEAGGAALTSEERAAARADGQGSTAATEPAPPPVPTAPDVAAADDEDAHSPPTTVTITDPEPPAEPDLPLRVSWAVGASGALAWQPLPALAPGVLAHAALQLDDVVRIELSAGYFARQGRAPDSDPHAIARFDALQASLSACGVAHTGGSELALCLGANAGVVRGDASALARGRDHDLPSSALVFGPVLMQPLFGTWALRVALLSQLALVRPRFQLDSGETVYAAKQFGFLGSLGVELRID